MGKEHDTILVKQALEMALAQRQPASGLVHHSDRGSEYASKSYQEMLQQRGIVISMSRKGDCYDNALISLQEASADRAFPEAPSCERASGVKKRDNGREDTNIFPVRKISRDAMRLIHAGWKSLCWIC